MDDRGQLGDNEVQGIPKEDLVMLVRVGRHKQQKAKEAYQVGVVGHVAAQSLAIALESDDIKS